MGPIAKILSPVGAALGLFDSKSSAPAPAPAPAPAAPAKLNVGEAEKKRLRRGRTSRPTIKTGALGLGDAESKASTILGG